MFINHLQASDFSRDCGQVDTYIFVIPVMVNGPHCRGVSGHELCQAVLYAAGPRADQTCFPNICISDYNTFHHLQRRFQGMMHNVISAA